MDITLRSSIGDEIRVFSDKEIQKIVDEKTGIITITGSDKIKMYCNGVYTKTYSCGSYTLGENINTITYQPLPDAMVSITFGKKEPTWRDKFNKKLFDVKFAIQYWFTMRFCNVPYF